jgi:hypothetical protein
MLKSYEAIYDHGRLEWIGKPPPDKRMKVMVVVEQPDESSSVVEAKPTRMKRRPPPELKGSVTWIGDPLEPAISEEEWEASLERTARQIAGDPEAFK